MNSLAGSILKYKTLKKAENIKEDDKNWYKTIQIKSINSRAIFFVEKNQNAVIFLLNDKYENDIFKFKECII